MTKKILLIEEDASVYSELQHRLIELGYDVVLATQGGDEGILLSVTESPDLILIDTDLSVINGWQAIKILKASTVTQKIPVMALTTLSEVDWKQALASGCDACELKPIDTASAVVKVKALLDSTVVIPTAKGSATQLNPLLFPVKLPQSSQIAGGVTNGALVDTLFESTLSPNSMVVYVDDSPLDSQHLAEIVRGAGYRFNSIAQPLDAMPRLLELKPQLIFLDLVMPFTNGYELCAQIRRISAFKGVPIIIVTNNDGIIDRVRARFVGASGFFSKPIQKDQVLRILDKHLKPTNNNQPQRFYQRSSLSAVLKRNNQLCSDNV